MTRYRFAHAALTVALAFQTSAWAVPPDWPATWAARKYVGEAESSWFGARALTVGDCDGDGIGDLMIAARFHSAAYFHDGRVTIYSGATGAVLHVLNGESPEAELGHRHDVIGDVDGDGRADILIGAYQHDSNRGRVYVFSGRTGEPIHIWTGQQQRSLFGWDISNAGDVNGDGVNDVLIGAMSFNGVGQKSGAAYLYDGRTGEQIYAWFGEAARDQFGFRAAAAGDIDGDGRPDIAIAAPSNSENGELAGKVYLYSGATGELIRSYLGENPGDMFGERIWGGFDLHNDGHGELLIGSLNYRPQRRRAGRVYLYSGVNGSLIRTFDGENATDQLGYRLKTLNDLNADGIREIAMSAIYYDGNGPDSGRVYIYSGATLDLLYQYTGDREGDRLGRVVQSLGDLNGDGYNDFAIASPFVSVDGLGAEVGRVYVYSGRNGSLLLRLTGEAAGDQFGYSVNDAGDVNGDGLPDFTVGAVYNDAGGLDAGAAYIFLGSSLYLSHTPLRAGRVGTVIVTGAAPEEYIYLLVSFAGRGEGPRLPGVGGLQLDLLPPVIVYAAMHADERGQADFVGLVPLRLAGRTIYLQAVAWRGVRGRDSVKSNPIAPVIEP